MANDRRGFLEATAKLCGFTITGAVTIPALGPLIHPLLADAVEFDADETALGPLERFPIGVPVKVPITANRRDGWTTTRGVPIGAVYVIRGDNEAYHVLSTTCPHLGCAVAASKEGFNCPCHGAAFTLGGQRLGDDNPSPRNMDPMEHTVRDGVLYCRFVAYRPGEEKRLPVRSAG